MPLAFTLLGDAIPPQLRPRAIGIFAGVVGASVPLGPLLGGAVVQGLDWRWIFWVNVPVALVLILLSRTRIEESLGSDTTLDVPGLALVTGAALGLIWGLVRGNALDWSNTEVLGTLALGAFVAWERRAREPMLPMRLFSNRSFSAGNAAIFLSWGSALGAIFFMAQFLQTGLGFGPLASGIRLLPWGAVVMLVPRIVGVLIPRFGERPFLAAGMSLQTVGMAWIAAIAQPTLAYWQLVAPLLLSGIGCAMATPAAQSCVLSTAATRDVGKSSGAFNTMRQLGGAFGVALLVAVFARTGTYASPAAFTRGFAPALGASAALALLATLAALAVPAWHTTQPAGTATIEASPDGTHSPHSTPGR
jgi:MFS family permease